MMSKICAVPQCGKSVYGHGWCEGHNRRNRLYGSPTAGRLENGAKMQFLDSALVSGSDKCIVWPYAAKGCRYALLYLNGSYKSGSRIICERFHGPPKSENLEAAHNCGNSLCVNPKHINWASRKENAADKIKHETILRGKKNPSNKLSENCVREIRTKAKSGKSYSSIARDYGVSKSTICGIVHRKKWAWFE